MNSVYILYLELKCFVREKCNLFNFLCKLLEQLVCDPV